MNFISKEIRKNNEQWWIDIHTGEPVERNVGELLMLCVSEIAEAMEGHRKNLPDDKLPHRSMFEVEIADVFIRLFDLAGGLDLDISGAIIEKLEFNATREDHKLENRLKENGKKY
jgi:NTP pyrophosphatase (non-canonical NTP hydrolase)